MPEENKTIKELEKEQRLLKRQLEDARLKSEAYLRMIEIAEKDMKLPINRNPSDLPGKPPGE